MSAFAIGDTLCIFYSKNARWPPAVTYRTVGKLRSQTGAPSGNPQQHHYEVFQEQTRNSDATAKMQQPACNLDRKCTRVIRDGERAHGVARGEGKLVRGKDVRPAVRFEVHGRLYDGWPFSIARNSTTVASSAEALAAEGDKTQIASEQQQGDTPPYTRSSRPPSGSTRPSKTRSHRGARQRLTRRMTR